MTENKGLEAVVINVMRQCKGSLQVYVEEK